MKQTTSRVVLTPTLVIFFLALTASQIAVSERGLAASGQTRSATAKTSTSQTNYVALKDDPASLSNFPIPKDVPQAEVRFVAQTSLEEAVEAGQGHDLRTIGIRYSFYVGDQPFVGYYSVPPDIGLGNIRAELLKEHKSFLQSMIASVEDPNENLASEDRANFQNTSTFARQSLDLTGSEKLTVETLTVEASPSVLEETKHASPLIESVDVFSEDPSNGLTPEFLIDSLRVGPRQPLGSVPPDEWVPRGRITVGAESRSRRYVLVRLQWDDVSGFGFASTFEPDFFLNNSSRSQLGPGTYLDRKENRLRIPQVAFWASNLPRPYLDTRSGDSSIEVSFTIGSADANRIRTNQLYFNYIRTKNGDASRDNAKFSVQRGSRIPITCFSTFCVFASDSVPIFTAWDIPIPGVAFF